jgi:hypothetical protein
VTSLVPFRESLYPGIPLETIYVPLVQDDFTRSGAKAAEDLLIWILFDDVVRDREAEGLLDHMINRYRRSAIPESGAAHTQEPGVRETLDLATPPLAAFAHLAIASGRGTIALFHQVDEIVE